MITKKKYQETEQIISLKKLKQKPNLKSKFLNTDSDLIEFNFDTFDLNNETVKTKPIIIDNKNLDIKITMNEDDSDDDDLVPFDTSNDIPLSKTKQPAYLRDCLDGKYMC